MRESWTDARLDGFAADVNRRFDEVDKRFDRLETRLDGIDADLKGLHRLVAQSAIALTSAILVGFGAVVGLVATQL